MPGIEQVRRVEWEQFLSEFAWRQGEHVGLIGPTGSGKSTLAIALLNMRDFVLAFGTKPTDKDSTLRKLVASGYRKVRTWEQIPKYVHGYHHKLRVLLWPIYKDPEADEPRQAFQIGKAIVEAFQRGGWCLYVDELWWAEKKLGLTRIIESCLTQGRSNDITMVIGVQRPAHVTLLVYSQSTHLFFWRTTDDADLKRIAGLNGLNARLVREIVASLPKHDVLYVNTRNETMAITRAPK